jgi:uncharacterized membrane protein YeaQ/YmgE (transglycosylase-associated protein family)
VLFAVAQPPAAPVYLAAAKLRVDACPRVGQIPSPEHRRPVSGQWGRPACGTMETLQMNMNAQQLIVMAVIGILAGWLASVLVGGPGSLLGYLITGIIGAFVGAFIFSSAGWKPNLGNAWLDDIVTALIGSIVVIFLARLVLGW